MPDLLDRVYCSEQIHIPPTFPYIMKLYCKAAIRTQPYDLLKWSAAYFRALANGEEPPAKERVEFPPYDSPSGLTPGFIKILINQFGKDPATTVTAQTLFKKWSDICLQEHLLIKLIALLGAPTTVNWVKFVGVCAGFISKTLTHTMILICELFTEEPEGGMASVPYDLFIDLYMFLAQMECGPLTEKEKEDQEAIMIEEDVCDIADKIKQGMYEAQVEVEGEFEYGEEMGEESNVLPEVVEKPESEEMMGEEEEEGMIRKELGEVSVEEEEAPEGMLEEVRGELIGEDEQGGEEEATVIDKDEQKQDGDSPVYRSEKSSVKEEESTKSVLMAEDEVPVAESVALEKEEIQIETKPLITEEVDEKVEELPEEVKPKRRKNLEDLEESIRIQIEQKLAEEESLMDEEEKEFEDLSSYLLEAATRVEQYTAEALGFRIFKKYMRQEVPGIGPYIDTEQVEKVVDFMDFWSNKQEQMVMPRNIRHWMCPPLDKIPTPEP